MDLPWTIVGLVAVTACGGSASPPTAPEAPAPVAPAPAAPTSAVPPSEEPASSPPIEPAPAENSPPPDEKRDHFKATPKGPPSSRAAPGVYDGGPCRNALGFPGIGSVLAQPAGQQLRLHFLDVGQGDSTLIECPGGQLILVDGGSGISASSQPQGARDHLRRVIGSAMKLDLVLVSHPDRDHYNALPYLLEGIDFGRIQLVGPAGEYSGGFVTWLAGVPAAKKKRLTAEAHDPMGSPSVDCGEASIHVLSVAARGTPDNSPKNSLSMTLMVSHGDFDAILTADATFVTEKKILGWYPAWWLDVELLKLGHHGSSTTSSSDDWVRTTAPDVAVVSSGHDNEHGHPRKVVVERAATKTGSAGSHAFRWYKSQTESEDLSDYREAIYGTGTSGTIVVASNGSDYWVERER